MKMLDKEKTEHPIAPESTNDENTEESELGRKLREIREQFIAEGGKLLSMEEIEAEVAERRGGYSGED